MVEVRERILEGVDQMAPGENANPLVGSQEASSLEGIPDERVLTNESQELLGPARCADGPEPGSGPPRQNGDPEMRVRGAG
jgi:hypothetical protein